MITWTSDELNKLGTAEELQIASLRRDGGVDKDVSFVEETNPEVNDQIDAAYRTKYRRYAASIINHMVSPEVRSATIKLVPR